MTTVIPTFFVASFSRLAAPEHGGDRSVNIHKVNCRWACSPHVNDVYQGYSVEFDTYPEAVVYACDFLNNSEYL